tara:strand:+ start:381 stop:641 length:261 start_codon:yes stop_codon:yes gene_type:complete
LLPFLSRTIGFAVCGLCLDCGRDDPDDRDDSNDIGVEDCGLDEGLDEVGLDLEDDPGLERIVAEDKVVVRCCAAVTLARSMLTSSL